MEYADVVRFHGHECPGLAMGFRMTTAGLEALRHERSADEELVAIVENDACGVDAVQFLAGCTFGKGNLRFRDYGKQAYTFYSRTSGKGVRVLFHGRGMPEGMTDRRERELYILSAPVDALLTVTPVTVDEPEPARIRESVTCALCGEQVMQTRTVQHKAGEVCRPCAERPA